MPAVIGLFHGGQALRRAGDLDQQVGQAGLVVQPPGERHRRRGVVGEAGRDLQRHVAVRAPGVLPRRPEQGRRLGQVLQRQRVHQVLRIPDTVARQPGQRTVIIRPGGHGMPQDRRVGRQPGDRQVTHVPGQRPGAQHDPADAVQPQALAQCMQPLRGIQLSIHAYLPDRPTRSSSPSQGHTSRLWRPGRQAAPSSALPVDPSPPPGLPAAHRLARRTRPIDLSVDGAGPGRDGDEPSRSVEGSTWATRQQAEPRVERLISFEHENQTGLDGSIVWKAFVKAGKAFEVGAFSGEALIHNLRDDDYG